MLLPTSLAPIFAQRCVFASKPFFFATEKIQLRCASSATLRAHRPSVLTLFSGFPRKCEIECFSQLPLPQILRKDDFLPLTPIVFPLKNYCLRSASSSKKLADRTSTSTFLSCSSSKFSVTCFFQLPLPLILWFCACGFVLSGFVLSTLVLTRLASDLSAYLVLHFCYLSA